MWIRSGRIKELERKENNERKKTGEGENKIINTAMEKCERGKLNGKWEDK